MRRVLLLVAALVAPGVAWGQTYKPDFNCAADHSKDSIATMLCQNSEAAKHELIFDQTYYALRQIVGKAGWKSLKQEAIADDDVLKECVAPIPDDGSLPVADPACYIAKMDAITAKYKSRLSGVALEEASRAIDQHIALQQKLVDLGYLPVGTQADGVYGEGTRQAIEVWQRVSRRPAASGFLSQADASVLLGSIPATSAENASPKAPPSSAYYNPQRPSAESNIPTSVQPNAISKICHGEPKPEQIILGFDDPYEVKGKCYLIRISSRFGEKQWLTEHAILINDSLPNSSDVYSTIITDPNGHVRYGAVAVVIGISPVQYTAASGELVIAPTLAVLKYVDDEQ